MPLFLALLLVPAFFSTTIERALESFEEGDYALTAALLDESAALEPADFERNNMPYLRGRVAALQRDWSRADQEFARIPGNSVLYPLSLWHRARIAVEEGREDDVIAFLDRLGTDFPAALRLEVAGSAPDALALRIYDRINTRESRSRRALLRNDSAGMWPLLNSNQSDDVALEIAIRLFQDRDDLSPEQRRLLAQTLHGHRRFDLAEILWRTLLDHTAYGPEAHYELGRSYFQRLQYDEAIAVFQQTATRFPDSDWEEDAERQIASSLWRQMDFAAAEQAYRGLIAKYDDPQDFESFVRDLVDVLRSQGKIDEALEWIERGLNSQPGASARAVLTFTRAKILFSERRFAEALQDFRQLRRLSLRPVANGTDAREVRFLQALTLVRLGQVADAEAIWRELAGDPFTYYGLYSLAQLQDPELDGTGVQERVWDWMRAASPDLCRNRQDPGTVQAIRNRRLDRTRGFRTEDTAEADLVGELVFLRQWEEAFYWANLAAPRWRDQALADLAYLAKDFRRAMLYADRLRPANEGQLFSLDGNEDAETRILMAMLYPTGYPDEVCREADAAGVNALWLRSIMWQESRYDRRARSGAAARGLMQFIPETADAVAFRLGMGPVSPEQLYRPEVSIRLGAHYWAELMDEFQYPELALAAYNGGPHNVRRWMAKTPSNDPMLFVSDIGFVQTKDYVNRVFGLFARYAHLQ